MIKTPHNSAELLERIGVTFKNAKILEEALTHRSYINEHKGLNRSHNERLEFLGDAVLELVVTEELFAKFPEEQEGKLTAYRSALVNTQSLAQCAQLIGLGDYILLSKGEAKDTGRARQVIMANGIEALIGAIHLDQGYDAAKLFIITFITPRLEEVMSKGLWQDAKSTFQEKAQDLEGVTPNYKTLEESGPDHDKKFTVGVFIADALIAKGEGKSKQEAEQVAAQNGLTARGW